MIELLIGFGIGFLPGILIGAYLNHKNFNLLSLIHDRIAKLEKSIQDFKAKV